MRNGCTKMVPKNLTTEQKANRRVECHAILDCLEREPEFFSRVIPGDEWWILEYDPEKKRQSREWHTANSPLPKNARMCKYKIKWMLFFIVRGSSTRNLCHQDKLSIKFFIGKSLKGSEKWWHVCDQALHALGCCTMTTPHVTWQSPSRNFWQKKYSCGSSAPLFARSQSLRLIFIPLAQKQLERAPFWYFG